MIYKQIPVQICGPFTAIEFKAGRLIRKHDYSGAYQWLIGDTIYFYRVVTNTLG